MTKDDWLELTVLEKKKYNYLVEIEDITRQLAESLDRNDQVSARRGRPPPETASGSFRSRRGRPGGCWSRWWRWTAV